MTNVSPPAPAGPGFVLKGWHVGVIVVAFFAGVVAVDVSMAIRAYSTFPGEVTAKPYEEGLGFNGEIHRRAAARAARTRAPPRSCRASCRSRDHGCGSIS